jgi:hypothetical protein
MDNRSDDDSTALVDEAVRVAGGVKGNEREMTSAQIARAIQHILFKAGSESRVRIIRLGDLWTRHDD